MAGIYERVQFEADPNKNSDISDLNMLFLILD